MTDILNLPTWTVINVDSSTPGEYHITAETDSSPRACPHCGVVNPKVYQFGKRPQEIADLPTHDRKVIIHAVTQRYKCRECGRTFYQSLPEMDERRQATVRLVNFIKRKALQRTFVSVAEDVRVDERTVRNIFEDYVSWLEETVKFETPVWLGMDEINLLNNKPAYGVFTNIKERTVFELLKNRNKDTVSRRLMDMKDRQKIELVAMDMWKPYREVVKALIPQAVVVVDKFHVVRMANKAVDDLRKDIGSEMQARQRRQIMRDHRILLKRANDLTAQQRLIRDVWLDNLPLLKRGYLLKEAFYDIYDIQSRSEAEKQYKIWQEAISPDLQPFFLELTRAVENWRDDIFTYFDHRVTNAFTEAANGVARTIDRQGRGYSFRAIRAKFLYNMADLKIATAPEEVVVSDDDEPVLIDSPGPIEAKGIDMDAIMVFQHLCTHQPPLTKEEVSTLMREFRNKKKDADSIIKSE